MSSRLLEKLHIILKTEHDMIHEGLCEWLDNNHFPRRFKIVINGNMGRRKQLLALAHELVHVKQYALNELKDTVRGPTNVKWKKEWVEESSVYHYDLPWEIEAYGRELGLYKRYAEHIAALNIRFPEP